MEKFGSRIRDGKNSDPQHWLWVRNFAFLACTVPVVVLQSVYTFRPLMIVNCTDTRNGHQSDPLPLVARCHSFRFIFTLIEQSYNIYIYYSQNTTYSCSVTIVKLQVMLLLFRQLFLSVLLIFARPFVFSFANILPCVLGKQNSSQPKIAYICYEISLFQPNFFKSSTSLYIIDCIRIAQKGFLCDIGTGTNKYFDLFSWISVMTSGDPLKR